MTELPPYALGVACNKWQIPAFWKSLISIQHPYSLMMSSGGALTDSNRNNIIMWFLKQNVADWLLFVDDDVEMPPNAASELLKAALEREALFMTGIYYRRVPPCDPLIYRRHADGWYSAYLPGQDYKVGDVMEIDGSGMGCTLIHKKAFSAILETHFLYRRHNKSYGFMPYDTVQEAPQLDVDPGLYIHNGTAYVVQQVTPMKPDHLGPNEALPFYALEYGRTEDFHFCELLKKADVKMWAHTGVECNHWGEAPINRAQFEQIRQWALEHQVTETVGGLPAVKDETP